MALLKEADLRSIGKVEKGKIQKTASQILEDFASIDVYEEFDIFLSHSYRDAEIILGLKTIIEMHGFSVYVDWIVDQQASRSNVTKTTAELLKNRMKRCKCLFYATSENAKYSIWMPWECGFFDGYKGNVAICPISKKLISGSKYYGQEYLGLYPWIDEAHQEGTTRKYLWVNFHNKKARRLDEWI